MFIIMRVSDEHVSILLDELGAYFVATMHFRLFSRSRFILINKIIAIFREVNVIYMKAGKDLNIKERDISLVRHL